MRLGKNETVYQYDSELRCKDGTIKTGRINSSVYRESDQFVHTRCFTIDVTEQKKTELALRESEERLKNAAETLEKQVEERTSELAEANRRLIAYNTQLEQFSYAASHDMKEPLRKIIFYNNYVWDFAADKLSGKEREYLERAMNAAKRMGSLIDNLLEFSRVSAVDHSFGQVNLNEMADEILYAYKDTLEQQGATLTFSSLPVVEGIAFQLRQLLENMVNNALRYRHPERAAVIHISCLKRSGITVEGLDATREYYELLVEDNGIGFRPSDANDIFEIFRRLHGVHASGTGVGLAICKKIAQNHHGNITASGEPDKGACFYVYLPVKQ